MRSVKMVIGFAIGLVAGVISYLAESVLVAILPSLGGVARWWPNTVLLLIAFAMGAACGLTLYLLTQFGKRVVLATAVLSYGLIESAVTIFLLSNAPHVEGSYSRSTAIITVAHVLTFAIGAVVGHIAVRIASRKVFRTRDFTGPV